MILYINKFVSVLNPQCELIYSLYSFEMVTMIDVLRMEILLILFRETRREKKKLVFLGKDATNCFDV